MLGRVVMISARVARNSRLVVSSASCASSNWRNSLSIERRSCDSTAEIPTIPMAPAATICARAAVQVMRCSSLTGRDGCAPARPAASSPAPRRMNPAAAGTAMEPNEYHVYRNTTSNA